MTAKCPWCMSDLDFRRLEKKLWVCAQGHVGVPKDTRNGLICRECNERVRQMVCPNCKLSLPLGFESFDEYVYLTLVGPKAVGKTVYMTILTDKIGAFFRANYKCSVITNQVSLSDHNNNIDNITRNGILPSYTEVNNQKSIIMEITNTVKHNKVALIIQDTPGEIYTNAEKSKEIERPPISNYLQKCDGILFLVDPLQMTTIRNIISIPEDKLPSDNITELQNLFNNVLSQFSNCIKRDKDNIDRKGKIKTKLATIIMKEDVLERIPQNIAEQEILFSDQSRVRSTFIGSGQVDLSAIDIVSDELKRYLDDYADGLSTNVEGLYKDYKFFAVSALGIEPVKDSNGVMKIDSNPRPFRITDPILWMLMATGCKILG